MYRRINLALAAAVIAMTVLSMAIQGCTGGAGGLLGVGGLAFNNDDEDNGSSTSSYATNYSAEIIDASGGQQGPALYSLVGTDTIDILITTDATSPVTVYSKTGLSSGGTFEVSNLKPTTYLVTMTFNGSKIKYKFSLANTNVQIMDQVGIDKTNTAEVFLTETALNHKLNNFTMVSKWVTGSSGDDKTGGSIRLSSININASSTENEIKSQILNEYTTHKNSVWANAALRPRMKTTISPTILPTVRVPVTTSTCTTTNPPTCSK